MFWWGFSAYHTIIPLPALSLALPTFNYRGRGCSGSVALLGLCPAAVGKVGVFRLPHTPIPSQGCPSLLGACVHADKTPNSNVRYSQLAERGTVPWLPSSWGYPEQGMSGVSTNHNRNKFILCPLFFFFCQWGGEGNCLISAKPAWKTRESRGSSCPASSSSVSRTQPSARATEPRPRRCPLSAALPCRQWVTQHGHGTCLPHPHSTQGGTCCLTASHRSRSFLSQESPG